MNSILVAAACAVFACHCAWGAGPAFEVASITSCDPGTPAPATEHMGTGNFVSSGGRFTAVVNRTGMDGEFDFTLDLTPDEHGGNPMMAQSMFLEALRDQIGLGVKSEKTAVDYYVIESAGKSTVSN